jgi:uncharacterized protein with PIN domain
VTTLRFFGELRDLIRVRHRDGAVPAAPGRRATVKDMIEACGIPHTEVGGISHGGRPLRFTDIPREDAAIDVTPLSPPVDVTRASFLRPQPHDRTRFVVDVNVGKLASLLRMLGVDTYYRNGMGDAEIAAVSETALRIVLTKDVALLKRKRILYGRLVRSRLPDRQLMEVVRFFGLHGPFRLFSRCLRCNTPLAPVEKERNPAPIGTQDKKVLPSIHPLPRLRPDLLAWIPPRRNGRPAQDGGYRHLGQMLLPLDAVGGEPGNGQFLVGAHHEDFHRAVGRVDGEDVVGPHPIDFRVDADAEV